MKLLKIDFSAVQKAMEDVSRDKYDYFLDLETGSVKTISQKLLEDAEKLLHINDSDIDEDYDIPEAVEKEIELAIKVFSEKDRYCRIPERSSEEAYALMNKFAESVEELQPHDEIMSALNSSANAFGKFKKALAGFPSYRAKWFAFNAAAMKKNINSWLRSIGIKQENTYH